MKILNLYSGIGGNRKLWGDEHEITAVELNPDIAKIYKDFFPKDTVIVEDAHKYLLNHYREFDFIWSSPPCPTHSRTNTFLNAQGIIRYPKMDLYQEIIFLKQFFKGKWVIENVIPYYEPLVLPTILIGRHYLWSNFKIHNIKIKDILNNITNSRESTRIPNKDYKEGLKKYHGFETSGYNLKNELQVLRNCVNPKVGQHILDCAMDYIRKTNLTQTTLEL